MYFKFIICIINRYTKVIVDKYKFLTKTIMKECKALIIAKEVISKELRLNFGVRVNVLDIVIMDCNLEEIIVTKLIQV